MAVMKIKDESLIHSFIHSIIQQMFLSLAHVLGAATTLGNETDGSLLSKYLFSQREQIVYK